MMTEGKYRPYRPGPVASHLHYPYLLSNHQKPPIASVPTTPLSTMAFLLGAGAHYTIKGVQAGIQAHKDHKSGEPIEPHLDRHGNPKDRHLAYGLVTKAEQRFNKGKGKGGVGSAADAPTTSASTRAIGGHGQRGPEIDSDSNNGRSLNKEEYERVNYGTQADRPVEQAVRLHMDIADSESDRQQAAPPSYETAIANPTTSNIRSGFESSAACQSVSDQGGRSATMKPTPAPGGKGLAATERTRRPQNERRGSSSSISSDAPVTTSGQN